MPVHPGVADTVEPLVASPCGSRMLLPIHRYRAYNTLHPGAMWTAGSANHVVGTTESASVVANQVRVSDRGAAAANPAARAAPTFLPETLSARTGLAIASSGRSVHASNTTTTVTGTVAWRAAAATLARHAGRRSRSLWAGTTTTISRKVGPIAAARRPRNC